MPVVYFYFLLISRNDVYRVHGTGRWGEHGRVVNVYAFFWYT